MPRTVAIKRAPKAKREKKVPAAESGASTQSKTTDLFERLRTDILTCKLKPGSRLIFRHLRENYSSGLSPLREALMRLVSDNLVRLEVNKGFRVSPVSQSELLDLTNTWIALEGIAVRTAIEKGDDRWEGNIIARLHELSKRAMYTANGKLDSEWDARNAAFHEALYAACDSPMLISFIHMLGERFSRYIRLWARHADPNRDIAGEHEEISKAVVGRNAERAVALLRDHRIITTKNLVDHWSASFSKEITEEL